MGRQFNLDEKENNNMSLLTLFKGPISGHNLILGIFFTTAAGVIVGYIMGQVIYHLLQ